jgi:hypothetical protein
MSEPLKWNDPDYIITPKEGQAVVDALSDKFDVELVGSLARGENSRKDIDIVFRASNGDEIMYFKEELRKLGWELLYKPSHEDEPNEEFGYFESWGKVINNKKVVMDVFYRDGEDMDEHRTHGETKARSSDFYWNISKRKVSEHDEKDIAKKIQDLITTQSSDPIVHEPTDGGYKSMTESIMASIKEEMDKAYDCYDEPLALGDTVYDPDTKKTCKVVNIFKAGTIMMLTLEDGQGNAYEVPSITVRREPRAENESKNSKYDQALKDVVAGKRTCHQVADEFGLGLKNVQAAVANLADKNEATDRKRFQIIPHTIEGGGYFTIEKDGQVVKDEKGEEMSFDSDEEADEYIFNHLMNESGSDELYCWTDVNGHYMPVGPGGTSNNDRTRNCPKCKKVMAPEWLTKRDLNRMTKVGGAQS